MTIQNNKAIHPLLQSFIPIAEGIAKTFGEFCEVVLHDCTVHPSSIVAIFNGHVTGRKVGSPITNHLANIKKEMSNDDFINDANISKHGTIKSSSMFIRDENQQVIGCLCINIETVYLQVARQVIDNLVSFAPIEQKDEKFAPDINVLQDQLIDEAVVVIGKPVSLMDKQEREEFVRYLDNKGLFLIKGAVQKVAELLNISKYTLYSYIEKS
ncbi:helix-turn-helix transcriptional regulator [Bacillus pinisoli]|uniref:helix-turn-helix transcriptional regulator n=1 Tax=Bacillus pinisoli TaxID=2901866 RepID=UPI001FF2869D|nr:PAS domain-containing protein [Bacillus pinisoli]